MTTPQLQPATPTEGRTVDKDEIIAEYRKGKPPPLTPAQRTMRAKAAAHARWAKADRVVESEKARQRVFDYYDRLVDPDGTMPEGERARRSESARKAHFAALAMSSSRARQK